MTQDQTILGTALLGDEERGGGGAFDAHDAATGAILGPPFRECDAADVAQACALAEAAAGSFRDLAPSVRGAFLEAVGEEILALQDTLILRAMRETGLPRARLEGERARTVGQLNYMAKSLREGRFFEATLDSAQPDRQPAPRPSLRRRHLAIGPVAVFGASNFPLAFSVAGGDTAAAFAAGCPVVVKGHPAHAGTGELVARAILRARRRSGLHPGVFSYLPGSTPALGTALVADARIRAVGFTGSRAVGIALMKVAAARPRPIPVYAEMSSVNPVFLFPAAARRRKSELARSFVASMTLGAGQFCTNPGILVAVRGGDLDGFVEEAGAALREVAPQVMLTEGIAGNYARGVAALEGAGKVRRVGEGAPAAEARRCAATLFAVDGEDLLADDRLAEEIFGATSLIVRVASVQDFAAVAARLAGQLTATVLHDPEDLPDVAKLLPVLEQCAGRILGNGWPTGVEVADAMVHGGPYPATSDGVSTSVGELAVRRFLRPVCYQNLDESLLPPPVQAANPWSVPQRIDGNP